MPVRAALLSNRRVFTELLIQQGMDLSNKKDETASRELIALAHEKNITAREFPKHDMNMLVGKRLHCTPVFPHPPPPKTPQRHPKDTL